MIDHPSLGIKSLRISEDTRIPVLGVRLKRAEGSGGNMMSIDCSPFGRCDTLFRHWNSREYSQSFLDDRIQVGKFVDRTQGWHACAVILNCLEFCAQFVLNMLEFWFGNLPDKVSERFCSGIGALMSASEEITNYGQKVVSSLGGKILI